MEHRSTHEYDVIVAGAGPTGFVLAIDLARRGVRVLLMEKDPDTKPWPKMDRSNARTMEIFRRMGIVDRVRALGYPPDASMDVFIVTRMSDPPLVRLHYPTAAAHRARIARTTDMSEPLEPYQLVSQNDLEPLFREVAESTPGLDLRFGCELISFTQDDDGVTVLTTTTGGAEANVRARYLVGCDGGRSTVRKAIGVKLEGQGGLAELTQIVFRSDDLYDRIPIGQGRHYYFADEWGSTIVVQGSRREFTLHGRIPDDVDQTEAVRSRLGFDCDVTVTNSVQWKFNLLLAERYRDGRVLLAGDAAHLVIPTGGLGMNTGVGDAVDLAWKLAATVQGWGGPAVLDSYETERRAVGHRNVAAAGWAAEGMMTWRRLWAPEVRDPTPAGDRLREEIAATADLFHRRVHEMLGVELGYSYAGSELIAGDGGPEDWDVQRYEAHTRPGIRLPHVWLADGTAVQDVMGPDYTLLDLTGAADMREISAAFASLGVPLTLVQRDEPHAREVYGAPALLMRPDLHIFWRGEQVPSDPNVVLRLAVRASGQIVGATSIGAAR